MRAYVLSSFVGHAAYYEWTCSLCGTAGTSCSVTSTLKRVHAGKLPAGSICSFCQTGFSAWMLEALQKACTGTLFGARGVFTAADGRAKPGCLQSQPFVI